MNRSFFGKISIFYGLCFLNATIFGYGAFSWSAHGRDIGDFISEQRQFKENLDNLIQELQKPKRFCNPQHLSKKFNIVEKKQDELDLKFFEVAGTRFLSPYERYSALTTLLEMKASVNRKVKAWVNYTLHTSTPLGIMVQYGFYHQNNALKLATDAKNIQLLVDARAFITSNEVNVVLEKKKQFISEIGCVDYTTLGYDEVIQVLTLAKHTQDEAIKGLLALSILVSPLVAIVFEYIDEK